MSWYIYACLCLFGKFVSDKVKMSLSGDCWNNNLLFLFYNDKVQQIDSSKLLCHLFLVLENISSSFCVDLIQ